MPTAKVTIHGGDYDCSEMVRMCYAAVGVLPRSSYMWTGNELELLGQYGFKQRSLSSPATGDVLWRAGHTEIYLGNGMQGGARGSETGGITGRQGDQTGSEVTRSAYRAKDWTVLLRYEGAKECQGIPCAIAAALVADHIIDHNAHGYSQPNRAGDGTTETVSITWEDYTVTWLKAPQRCTVSGRVAIVREAPKTSAKIVTRYAKGEHVSIDGVTAANGRWWGVYVGASTGLTRFVSLDAVRPVVA